jgi:hypothetical protein
MMHRDGPLPQGGPLVGFNHWLPRPLTAIRHYLRPLVAERFRWEKARPTKLSGTARELEAIGNYARFAARHPDMPYYHRERILRQIVKRCEDAKAGLP